jgi:carboxypeptidase PM20D1
VISLHTKWHIDSGRDDVVGMLGKLGLGALVVGVAAVSVRTLTFAPSGVADASGVVLAKAPAFEISTAAAHLSAAIRFQTVSHQDAAANKLEEWEKLHSWMQSTYPAAHAAMSREVIADRTLLYHWQGSDAAAQPIIMMAHQDVVPVTEGTEKDWKHAPFGGEIAENAVWGRGAVDDKGSLIALFEALEALAKSGFKPKRSIWIVSGHDEEVGGYGAKAVADALASRKVKAVFTLDEGSVIIEDAPIINAPAILIGVAEKGYTSLKVTANAPGGHSSMPPKEIGTVEVAKAVIAINAKQFPSELHAPVTTMMEVFAQKKGGLQKLAIANSWLFGSTIKRKMADSPAAAAMLHTTIAPTMLQGSPKENVLPQSANAIINYRIAPWNSSKDVLASAKAAVGKQALSFEWTRPPREPSPISSSTSVGWKLVRAAAEAEAPGAVVAPYLVVAGTDSAKMVGVSDDVYRFAPLKLLSKDAGMIHGTNEHMTLPNLARIIGFYARLIATAAG